ncbi:MAG TPA: flavodoxin-dependent (E)-4-hydroxy-3-methylbut-2-enyl-diphosphate synthase [Negativicutes bacterium]|nr:flavodoxin-dependent (E)-4-hydroxy-3-methylbut-2-enyl-diphosphate synthase [Negativicutes bacterium]
MINRKKTRPVRVGSIVVGGNAPVSIQSMTNTPTADLAATTAQIAALAQAGCDIVRVAVPDMAAATALGEIKKRTLLPLVADIHFDHRLAIEALKQGVDGLRINPGNIGDREKVKTVVNMAKERRIPIRIGVNAGSLEKSLLKKYGRPTPEAMVASALGHINILEELGFHDIKISLKSHDVMTTIRAYQLMSESVDYPLHVGITEAGTVRSGTVKSAVGIGALLVQGIGDTIRVSLTGDPVEEVRVARQILKSLELRRSGATLVSCPTCGRCEIDLASLAEAVEERISNIDRPIKVAVMGCVVNGPGEAREADIGLAGGKGAGLIFRQGKIIKKVAEAELLDSFCQELAILLEEEN